MVQSIPAAHLTRLNHVALARGAAHQPHRMRGAQMNLHASVSAPRAWPFHGGEGVAADAQERELTLRMRSQVRR